MENYEETGNRGHVVSSVVVDRGEDTQMSQIASTPPAPGRKRSLSPFFKMLRKNRNANLPANDLVMEDRSSEICRPLLNRTNFPPVTDSTVLAVVVDTTNIDSLKSSRLESHSPNQIEQEVAGKLKMFATKIDNIDSILSPRSTITRAEPLRNQLLVSSGSEQTNIPLEEKSFESENDKTSFTASATSTKYYYSVMWAKASTRKHKKWESDGFLYLSDKGLVLKSVTGKVLDSSCSSKLDAESLEEGKIIKLGSREIEIQERLKVDPLSAKVVFEEVEIPINLTKLPTKLISRPFVLPCAPRIEEKANADSNKPMFDPCAPNALVMPQLEDSETVKVVVDPHLTRHLRCHQREGVIFLYKCVMGRYTQGAILADEMGLGKTLQCITLLWTIMKQTAYGRKNVVKRSLIVAPSSLVTNWENEFNRWLGNERIRVYAVNSDHPLKHYPPQCPVIIISYDMATRSEDTLKRMKFDLMICDEAHKIKNSNGQAYSLLNNFGCSKRILLTGTPIQNDLMELYSLVDFANPGILGKDFEFRKKFEKPIAKFQERHSTISEVQCFEAMQLNLELQKFFLRRSHDVMIRYLPPKITTIVICKPTQLQIKLYEKLLASKFVEEHLKDNCMGVGNNQSPLSVILALKKICNHPNLVHPKNQANNDTTLYKELSSVFPMGFRSDHNHIIHSGKLKVLVCLLKNISESREKVVLVSHYTKTLDIFEEMCNINSFKYKRLDGNTLSKCRQQIVDQFNKKADEFLFLLSSKAGGIGLNLQGASNIILYDIDWNPAHDIQAMARCWRPGQKKETNIYRFLTGGTIEEKMYHRQISKMDLSGSVMDLLMSNGSIKFSPEELKDIFTFRGRNTCLTHDMLECDCICDGTNTELNCSLDETENTPPQKKRKGMSAMGDLSKWEHFGPPFMNSSLNAGLLEAASDLQFLFRSQSLNSNVAAEVDI